MLCNMFGVIFGGYGLFFLVDRVFYSDFASSDPTSASTKPTPADASTAWIYVFIFHRLLMIGGDVLPSLDRATALLFPIKFYCHCSPGIAGGIVFELTAPIFTYKHPNSAVRVCKINVSRN